MRHRRRRPPRYDNKHCSTIEAAVVTVVVVLAAGGQRQRDRAEQFVSFCFVSLVCYPGGGCVVVALN